MDVKSLLIVRIEETARSFGREEFAREGPIDKAEPGPRVAQAHVVATRQRCAFLRRQLPAFIEDLRLLPEYEGKGNGAAYRLLNHDLHRIGAVLRDGMWRLPEDAGDGSNA